MEFIIDTFNLEEIKDAVDHLPISGVTSNPSIVKATAPKDFWAHAKKIREIIGLDRSLHVQVTAKDAEGMVKEAHAIFEHIDDQVYVKIPTSYEGVKAIKILKAEGHNVTATAIYTQMQAYYAYAAGADFLAPYVNRIGNLGGDPFELISQVSSRIMMEGSDCKILAASFKGVEQVLDAFNAGAQTATVPVAILKSVFANPSIDKAVDDFNADWYSVYGENTSLCDL